MTRHRSLATTALLCLMLAAFVTAAPDLRAGITCPVGAAGQPIGQQTPAAATEPAQAVAGATNFVRLDANFASGGVTSPEAFAAIKRLGFRTVINLRTASEPGADIEGEAAIVERAGLRYISLPFSTSAPDVTVLDRFLDLAKDAGNQPVYIHCYTGQRANAFWMVKRVLVDGWTQEKALAEADSLKMANQRLREIAAAYLKDHAK